tara:strand:- start:18681 stop:18956 length:276 start_codon:yes stop_codon:yes gene_type:complete
VVSIDRAGNQYVSIKGEGKCSTSVGVTPVVAITSNDKLPKGVNQHFVQCFDVFDARLWQVALFPLHLLGLAQLALLLVTKVWYDGALTSLV